MSLASGGSSPGAVIGVIVIWLAVFAAYWTPAIVAGLRHVPNWGSVAVIDGFLGWTVIGWIVALAMACRSVPSAVPPAMPPVRWPEPPRRSGQLPP